MRNVKAIMIEDFDEFLKLEELTEETKNKIKSLENVSFDDEKLSLFSMIISIYLLKEDFDIIKDMVLTIISQARKDNMERAIISLLDDLTIFKNFILEQHKINFNALLKCVLEDISKFILIKEVEEDER